MIRSFALHPKAVRDGSIAGLVAFMQKLGVENGRLLAELPMDWAAAALAELDGAVDGNTGDGRHAREIVHHLRLHTYLRDPRHRFDPSRGWEDNVLFNSNGLSAVFVPEADVPRSRIPRAAALSEVVTATPDYWAVQRECEFDATVSKVVDSLVSLASLDDTRLVIFDPYFDPSQDRYASVVKALVARAPRVQTVRIHCSAATKKGGKPQNEEEWRDLIRSVDWGVTIGRRIVFTRWDAGLRQRDGKQVTTGNPHDRWAVNAWGGVALSRGFAADGQPIVCSLLSNQRASDLLAEFGRDDFTAPSYPWTFKHRQTESVSGVVAVPGRTL